MEILLHGLEVGIEEGRFTGPLDLSIRFQKGCLARTVQLTGKRSDGLLPGYVGGPFERGIDVHDAVVACNAILVEDKLVKSHAFVAGGEHRTERHLALLQRLLHGLAARYIDAYPDHPEGLSLVIVLALPQRVNPNYLAITADHPVLVVEEGMVPQRPLDPFVRYLDIIRVHYRVPGVEVRLVAGLVETKYVVHFL
ncbi:MAG: hypothetical protein A4E31_01366 [Methanomassiliicoccales archaeon PtaU1.Bin030]|nr:MAG: hypothetical protein A4E31_01366 [Methanomassiliicoccales archaeon PtaU1.Bin030]